MSATRSYAYDSHYRLCRQTNPESASTVWGYDADSRVIWKGEGQSGSGCLSSAPSDAALYQYDAMGRKTLDDYPGTNDDVTYGYDNDGHTVSVANNATWALIYAYNHRGLLSSELDGDVSYSFDTQGHVSQETTLFGPVRSYSPDAWGEPTQISNYVTNIQYYPNGTPSHYTLGNGLHYSASLDGRQRLQTQALSSASQTLQSLTYHYNDNNDLTSMVDNVDGSDTASFGYDGLHRLTSAAGLWGNYTYTYDALNNLRSRSGSNPLTLNYDPATNRLSSTSGAVSHQYSYDARGRPTSDGQRTYVWNALDQLSSIPGVANYNYFGTGKRYNWLSPSADTGEGTYYDASGKLLFISYGTNTTGGSYDWLYVGGQAVAQVAHDGSATYLHPDLLGSPRLATTSTGAIAWREHFDPYGIKLNNVNEFIGYTGHKYDANTGLTYAGARYYDPQIGRFLTTDPIAFTGSPFSFNRYSYANNSPYGYTDPTGMVSNCTGTRLGCDGAGSSPVSGDGARQAAANEKTQNASVQGKPLITRLSIIYNPQTSQGRLSAFAGDESIFDGGVTVGGDGHVTPTGDFHASHWESDHKSSLYGWLADTPWSRSILGLNAFGPFQLHIKELDNRGIYIHGTMGPGWLPTRKISSFAVSETSHGCVRMCNPDIIRLHDLIPNPAGLPIHIGTDPNLP